MSSHFPPLLAKNFDLPSGLFSFQPQTPSLPEKASPQKSVIIHVTKSFLLFNQMLEETFVPRKRDITLYAVIEDESLIEQWDNFDRKIILLKITEKLKSLDLEENMECLCGQFSTKSTKKLADHLKESHIKLHQIRKNIFTKTTAREKYLESSTTRLHNIFKKALYTPEFSLFDRASGENFPAPPTDEQKKSVYAMIKKEFQLQSFKPSVVCACGSTQREKSDLWDHINTRHIQYNDPDHDCALCKKTHLTARQLFAHERKKHPELATKKRKAQALED